MRHATARSHAESACSTVPPASLTGSFSARGAAAAGGASEVASCTSTVMSRQATPRASTARTIPAAYVDLDPRAALPNSTNATNEFPHRLGKFTFGKIAAVCSTRPNINTLEQYILPYTVDRLLEEQHQERMARKMRHSSCSSTTAESQMSSSHSSILSDSRFIGRTMPKCRQELFLTTRTRTPREFAPTAEKCRVHLYVIMRACLCACV